MTMTFHDRVVSEVTQLDAANAHKPRSQWNPYFLGIALRTLAEVEDEMPKATDLEVFTATFTPTRETHKIAKKLGLPLDVDRGQWVVTA